MDKATSRKVRRLFNYMTAKAHPFSWVNLLDSISCTRPSGFRFAGAKGTACLNMKCSTKKAKTLRLVQDNTTRVTVYEERTWTLHEVECKPYKTSSCEEEEAAAEAAAGKAKPPFLHLQLINALIQRVRDARSLQRPCDLRHKG